MFVCLTTARTTLSLCSLLSVCLVEGFYSILLFYTRQTGTYSRSSSPFPSVHPSLSAACSPHITHFDSPWMRSPQGGISWLLGVLLLNSWQPFFPNTTQSITFNMICWQTEGYRRLRERVWHSPGACKAASRAMSSCGVCFSLLRRLKRGEH